MSLEQLIPGTCSHLHTKSHQEWYNTHSNNIIQQLVLFFFIGIPCQPQCCASRSCVQKHFNRAQKVSQDH